MLTYARIRVCFRMLPIPLSCLVCLTKDASAGACPAARICRRCWCSCKVQLSGRHRVLVTSTAQRCRCRLLKPPYSACFRRERSGHRRWRQRWRGGCSCFDACGFRARVRRRSSRELQVCWVSVYIGAVIVMIHSDES